jgi:hypothetical protein
MFDVSYRAEITVRCLFVYQYQIDLDRGNRFPLQIFWLFGVLNLYVSMLPLGQSLVFLISTFVKFHLDLVKGIVLIVLISS